MNFSFTGGRKAGMAVMGLCALSLAACQSPRRHDEPAPGFRADDSQAYRVADRGLDSCFNARNLNNWRVVGRRTINVGIGASQVYQLTLLGDCPDLDTRESFAFASSSSNVCNPADATIIVGTPIGPRRCSVRSIRRMSEAEIQSLRPGERP